MSDAITQWMGPSCDVVETGLGGSSARELAGEAIAVLCFGQEQNLGVAVGCMGSESRTVSH